jgi:hypothetical protein
MKCKKNLVVWFLKQERVDRRKMTIGILWHPELFKVKALARSGLGIQAIRSHLSQTSFRACQSRIFADAR